ncbi:putative protein U3 [Harrison Dam virus]|uniref:Uncharacterized protein n=1 Tax=Harrison Dam virus TaxID=1569259 RepID=A0A0A0V7W2_9RHAB|nr:putative protein U3 [Harrison Dam virus]AIW61116.1 putative protein U3 [Harrison Dam virus]
MIYQLTETMYPNLFRIGKY